MLIIDGHEDLAYNGVELERRIAGPLEAMREQEGTPPAHGEGTATVSLPALRGADIRLVLATIFTYPARAAGPLPGYSTPDEAFARAGAQLAYYRRLHERWEVTLVGNQSDLNAVLAQHRPTPGLCLLLEGADPLRTPADLGVFVRAGVRIIGLAWKATRYAAGTGAPGPLTDLGRELLREMNRLELALDVSHLAEEAFWQALEIFHGRVIASHANCRALVPGDRQLSDDMIRAIADRDGVIGLVCYNRFVRAGWTAQEGKDAVGFADLRRHADHLMTLVGPRHIALGSDLDGGIGREDVPREIDSVADLPRFAETLTAAGYRPVDIAAIMGGNWLRVLRAILR
ncbi:MAG TPA: membrane dipeptidase [Armatimonadota bacterium]|jgi:membrane dipeptidase